MPVPLDGELVRELTRNGRQMVFTLRWGWVDAELLAENVRFADDINRKAAEIERLEKRVKFLLDTLISAEAA